MLDDYLDAAMRQPWQWGVMDCVHFGGGWVADATGRDPCAPWRGSYSTPEGAQQVIKKAGGFVALVDDAMTRCGFSRAKNLEHGDIAIVRVPKWRDEYAEALYAAVAIYCSGWMLARGTRGLFGGRIDPVAVWRVLP